MENRASWISREAPGLVSKPVNALPPSSDVLLSVRQIKEKIVDAGQVVLAFGAQSIDHLPSGPGLDILRPGPPADRLPQFESAEDLTRSDSFPRAVQPLGMFT